MITYDESKLTCPRFSGFRVLPQKRFRRLGVLDGPPRYRLTQPNNTYLVNILWTYDKDQMKFFRDFYHNGLIDGSSWFIVKLDIGEGMKNYEAHFADEWNSQPNGAEHWDVSATLEIRNTPSHPIVSFSTTIW